jgi:outer membrane protein TolC
MRTSLIDQALASNREVKILAQDVQIAANEILARRGAYLPFVTFGAARG